LFIPGQIVYFKEFFFKNGNTSKPKYFIVLAVGPKLIVASLPTRSNLSPLLVNKFHGCINLDERCFNCYAFEAKKIIGKSGFSFELPTFIYGDQVENYELELMEDIYKIRGVDYEVLDILMDSEFIEVINCIKNSASAKRKIKRLLSD
jgi:hypothetical protein